MTDYDSVYDAVIVGAGAGGGVAAGVLAEAGKRVLLLERGPQRTYETVGRDPLRNQRLSLYGVNAGPELDGNPRVAVSPNGKSAAIVGPLDGRYQNNATGVGGGTVVYGAQAWRFLPQDFRMASLYGIPSGSSLSDWPLTYDDLAPDYERAEWELGVAGDATVPGRPHQRLYPMPPLMLNTQGRTLQLGADTLGWETQRVPLLINSVPYKNRDACVHCQHCVGFACPTDAKNGTQNTLIPRALASGNATLVTGAMAERIETDSAGRVVGVTYWNDQNARITVTADVVIVAAGAIESARLLLNSRSPAYPHGLGNTCDQVGRHLQGHYYAGATGWMPDPIWDGIGPGPTTATIRFNHHNDSIIGGGMLCDDFITLPINFVKGRVPAEVPRWGQAHKQWVRHHYPRMLLAMGPVQEIPSPDSRITLDPDVRDRHGIPVPRLSGTTHSETLRTFEYMNARAADWLRACGASGIHVNTAGLYLSAGQHQAGTCRMGDDPKVSVTDAWGRVHGHDNLCVADGSLHVTNGGFNPVLTILALAYRVSGHLVKSW